MQLEEIESRILHSADLTPIAFGDPVGQVEMRIIDTAPAVLETKSQQTTTNEVVFVDAATPDYRQLIDDIAARANGERDLQVVLIENDSDGIHKISDVLSGLQNIDAIHIISHGSDGNVRLGATVLDAAALRERGAEIQAWASSLTQNADILLYGCDVAQQADGRSLVDNLASLTGADVAASDDITGAATRGGNWVLEYQTGSIEAAAAISIAAQQSWQGTLANSAPVLTGANNAAPINEDAVSNGGTLVSALITSPNRTSDADVGALQGIAVTSVGNTNGVWEYSIDNRSTWNAFGAPTLASARLLTADAVTYVRFVPNADWNGTVTNGLTFRAWDQTSGVAGATADTTTASLTVADNFTAPIYANNDGTATWAGNWVGGGGNIVITGGQLVISTALLASDTIDRGVDLSGATSATLSFSYNNQLGLLGLLGSVTVEASTNGTSYTTLATFSSLANTGSGVHSVDISSYMSSTTRVRFALNGIAAGGLLNVDNLQISFVTPLNGGATAFSSATASSSITVNPINDAPVGTSNTVTTNEDTPFVFNAAAFGFSDPSDTPTNNLLAVRITTLPSAGSLTLSGVAVSAGQSVSAVNIAAGNLLFTPAANANGAGYASFTFQVQDDGGTTNGGVDLDAVARTLTINVTPVNDAPIGASNTVVTNEDTPFAFNAAAFGFSDPTDTPANSLLAVKIGTLPSAGSLTLSGAAVSAGQSVSAVDIAAGNLVFAPAANANGAGYAGFTFQVQDDGGTANGGVDLDAVARTMTINVTAVNDAPIGTSNTVVTNEDTPFVFSTASFGFTDPTDAPANSLLAVKITGLPVAGALTLTSFGSVTAGQVISAADITAGKLVFTPA
ncbi:MAG: hypothetical protein QOK44_1931, partial [Betaproteobacteria bacterium]|nr:hypothetical protein [Betaproteobacteria bacterium]